MDLVLTGQRSRTSLLDLTPMYYHMSMSVMETKPNRAQATVITPSGPRWFLARHKKWLVLVAVVAIAGVALTIWWLTQRKSPPPIETTEELIRRIGEQGPPIPDQLPQTQ